MLAKCVGNIKVLRPDDLSRLLVGRNAPLPPPKERLGVSAFSVAFPKKYGTFTFAGRQRLYGAKKQIL